MFPVLSYFIHFQVQVAYPSRSKSFVLTPSRRSLGKALGRGSRQSLAKHAVHDARIRAHLVNCLKKSVKSEIKALCSKSLLLQKGKDSICSFRWEQFQADLHDKAPVLSGLLHGCIPSTSRCNPAAIVGMCVSILAKARQPTACLVQQLVSLVLYAGHASKQVGV